MTHLEDMADHIDVVVIKARLKWFNATKGFGFVSPEDGSPDAFLHVSVMHRTGLQKIGEQAELLCEVGRGPKGPQVSRIVEVLSEGIVGEGPYGMATGGEYDGYQDPNGGFLSRQQDRVAMGPEEEIIGTVKWFKADKGFGFITVEGSERDIFVHKSVLQKSGIFALEPGQKVSARVHEVQKGREATWVGVSEKF